MRSPTYASVMATIAVVMAVVALLLALMDDDEDDEGAGEQGSAVSVTGPPGSPGSARAYAHLDPSDCTGTRCPVTRSKGTWAVRPKGDGIYCASVEGIDARDVAAVATVDFAQTAEHVDGGNAEVTVSAAADSRVDCPADETFLVVTHHRRLVKAKHTDNAPPGPRGGPPLDPTLSGIPGFSDEVSFSIVVP